MYIDKGAYFLLEEFDRAGIEVVYTDKKFGDAKKKTKNELTEYFNLKERVIVSGFQTHTKNIQIIKDEKKLYFDNTDGYITNKKNVAIFTKYGDCLPIFLYDPKKEVIGVVHSGWKGTYEQIGMHAVELFASEYGSNRKDIKIAFGIGICADDYEVGPEFLERFKSRFTVDMIKGAFITKNDKIYFDNQKFNFLNFVKHGITPDNLITNDLCTYEDERFFSYRRERNDPGRNGALIYFK